MSARREHPLVPRAAVRVHAVRAAAGNPARARSGTGRRWPGHACPIRSSVTLGVRPGRSARLAMMRRVPSATQTCTMVPSRRSVWPLITSVPPRSQPVQTPGLVGAEPLDRAVDVVVSVEPDVGRVGARPEEHPVAIDAGDLTDLERRRGDGRATDDQASGVLLVDEPDRGTVRQVHRQAWSDIDPGGVAAGPREPGRPGRASTTQTRRSRWSRGQGREQDSACRSQVTSARYSSSK